MYGHVLIKLDRSACTPKSVHGGFLMFVVFPSNFNFQRGGFIDVNRISSLPPSPPGPQCISIMIIMYNVITSPVAIRNFAVMR